MNIFAALSEGRGRLTETNLSAFLGFLLTPNRAHGLSDTFLRGFLEVVADACGDRDRFASILNANRIDAEVGLEIRHPIGAGSRTVDVEVMLYAAGPVGESAEIHRLIIENKIKHGAAQEIQFKEEFESVIAEVDEGTRISAIFLTPGGSASGLSAEYESLVLPESSQHRKVWLRWANHPGDGGAPSIADLIREMLRKESVAEIEPVSEYTRHTLKAFAQFVSALIVQNAFTRAITNTENEEIIEERQVVVAGGGYRLVRFDTGTIKAYDQVTGQEVSAKPLLRSLNAEMRLGVELTNSKGNIRNTRQLGRAIMDKLRELSA